MFGSLVTLFLFTYLSNTSRMPPKSMGLFLLLIRSPFWVQKRKYVLIHGPLFSPHLCKTKAMQQLVSVTSVTSIPCTWVLNIPISCFCTSLFYCPGHTLSSCKDDDHRQPLLRRNKRPFISFSYIIIFLICFAKRRHGKQESHEYQLKFTCFQYF